MYAPIVAACDNAIARFALRAWLSDCADAAVGVACVMGAHCWGDQRGARGRGTRSRCYATSMLKRRSYSPLANDRLWLDLHIAFTLDLSPLEMRDAHRFAMPP